MAIKAPTLFNFNDYIEHLNELHQDDVRDGFQNLGDTFRSRAISLIVLPLMNCSRRIRAIVSTISIPDHLLHYKAGSATDQPVGVNIAGRMTVKERNAKLIAGFQHWSLRFGGKGPKYPGLPYVLLHSLSHALMSEIALDCGYPASALKERVYALPETDVGRFGILIYTATAGAQGTLGGLVATAPRFASILKAALDRIAICSNDPVCSDHEPDTQSGDRATHGAACHSCLLIAETSCESRNLYLDRALLVQTMSATGEAFF